MKNKIETYLKQCRELVQFTHQNGWIDNNTLTMKILKQTGNCVQVEVGFEEIIMGSSGCCAVNEQCWGKLALTVDENGVIASEIIE